MLYIFNKIQSYVIVAQATKCCSPEGNGLALGLAEEGTPTDKDHNSKAQKPQ
jgi:hypothetical protein